MQLLSFARAVLLAMLCVVTILAPTVAQALAPGDVIEDGSPIFDDTSAAFAPNGLGSPAVFWDDRLNRWIMITEYQSAATDPDCPHGIWGLAYSTTTDATGASGWTAPVSLAEPTVDGSYRSCVMAHPGGMFGYNVVLGTTNYRQLYILFKAETDEAVAAGTDCVLVDGQPTDRCVYTGIGRMRLQFGLAGNLVGTFITATEMISIDEPFGFQSPVHNVGAGEYYMLVQVGDSVYKTTSTAPASNWSALTLVQTPSVESWNQDEIFGPELMCGENPGELITFIGGKTFLGGGSSIAEAGWAEMTSVDDGVTWALNTVPVVSWFDDLDWRHWSSVRMGPDAYYVWLARKNAASNHLEIWRAEAVGSGGSIVAPIDRRCF